MSEATPMPSPTTVSKSCRTDRHFRLELAGVRGTLRSVPDDLISEHRPKAGLRDVQAIERGRLWTVKEGTMDGQRRHQDRSRTGGRCVRCMTDSIVEWAYAAFMPPRSFHGAMTTRLRIDQRCHPRPQTGNHPSADR